MTKKKPKKKDGVEVKTRIGAYLRRVIMEEARKNGRTLANEVAIRLHESVMKQALGDGYSGGW